MDLNEVKSLIRDIPDFPKPGIIFKDITPVLAHPEAFKFIIDEMANKYSNANVDLVLGAEARGFILAATIAYKLGAGFIPARKPGKLPYNTKKAEYELEYGVDTLEMHEDAVAGHHNVLIVDDVLATGGTASAKVKLVEEMGATVVGVAFLIELTFLNGIDKLQGQDIFSLIKY